MLNFTQAEIEGGLEMVVLSPAPQERKRLAELKLRTAVMKSREMRETERVRALVEREEQNGRGVKVGIVSLSPTSSIYVCNAAYRNFFRHRLEALNEWVENKTILAYQELGMVAPEDREVYVEMLMTDVGLGMIPPNTCRKEIFKMVDNEGEIGLFLFERRHRRWETGEEETVFVVEPVPPSR
jgi:hypothetical protein